MRDGGDNIGIASFIHKLITTLPGIVVLIGVLLATLFYYYPADIEYFNAIPGEIKLGESSTLAWKVNRANSVEIDQGFGTVPNEDLRDITPVETTLYTLTARNFFGERQEQIKVTVTPSMPVITYFYADPESINNGETSTLRWSVSDADIIYIDHGIHEVNSRGHEYVFPQVTTTYTLTASNKAGSTSRQVRVEVSSPRPLSLPDISHFYADPESINNGETSTLRWSVSDADSVYIDHGIGKIDPEGTKNVFPQVTTTYTLTARNTAGSNNRQVRVEVLTSFKANYSASDWIREGDALRYMEKYDESAIAYENAIKRDPTNSYAWSCRSRVLYLQKKFDESLISSENAIEFDPKSEIAWNSKGNALSGLGRIDEAMQAYDKAIALNSTYGPPWYNKGLALFDLGNYDEAIHAFDEAIRLEQENDSEGCSYAWFYKGQALKAFGNTTESDVAFAKARDLGYTG